MIISIFSLLILVKLTLFSISWADSTSKYNHKSTEYNSGYDHRAHAVTGGPYLGTDEIGEGTATVKLDGHLSHSHYFNPVTGVTGKVVRYVWTYMSLQTLSEENKLLINKTICESIQCVIRFPIGINKIKLSVMDNTGDESQAHTKVIITDGVRKGLRYLIYPGRQWIPFHYSKESIKPTFSLTRQKINFNPSILKNYKLNISKSYPFSIRMLGTLRLTRSQNIIFKVLCYDESVKCAFHVGPRPVLKSKGYQELQLTSERMWFMSGDYQIHVLYRKKIEATNIEQSLTPSPKEKLRISVLWKTESMDKFEFIPPSVFYHRPILIKPVIHFAQPRSIKVGSVLTLKGSGFIDVRYITIAGKACHIVHQHPSTEKLKNINIADLNQLQQNQFSVQCIVPGIQSGAGSKVVLLKTLAGLSNRVRVNVLSHDVGGNPSKTNANTSTDNDEEEENTPNDGDNDDDDGNENEPNDNIDGNTNNTTNPTNTTESPTTNSTNPSSMGPLGYYQPIKFRKSMLSYIDSGKPFLSPQLTTITLGPDFRYYLGSLNGHIHSIKVNQPYSSKIIDHCRSYDDMGVHRSVLGLSFNPHDAGFKLYASISVLYWKSKRILLSEDGWANGQIVTIKKHETKCLVKSKVIISGLPVSNYDHAVNSITFDDDGRLFVSVGCSTNAGASKPYDSMGGVPDSPLSGSIIMLDLNQFKQAHLRYNQYTDPGTAFLSNNNKNISIYAYGVRNSFGMTFHSNNWLYATDNGANPKYGNQSLTCTKEIKATHEKDTLKRIKEGMFYGYANRNRGRWDSYQCVHHRPSLKSENEFDGAIIRNLEASTNGIIEYTSNTFGGQLRNELILSKFAVHGDGQLTRVKLNPSDDEGKEIDAVLNLIDWSGLGITMSGVGGFLMPRVYQGLVATLIPVEKDPGFISVTSVLPCRGRFNGGNTVMVTGWRLWIPLRIYFILNDDSNDMRECTNVQHIYGSIQEKDGRGVTCVVPAGQKGMKAKVVAVRDGTTSSSFGFEYMYMNI